MPAVLAVLAAEIWHWWIGVVLVVVAILSVSGSGCSTSRTSRPSSTRTVASSKTADRAWASSRRRDRRAAGPLLVPPAGTARRLRLLRRRRLDGARRPRRGRRLPRHGDPRRSRAAGRRRATRPSRPATWPRPSGSPSGSRASSSPTGRTSRPGPVPPGRAALPAGVLTGHTADDRAETMLINLLRGAGLDGLARDGPGPTRPLLGAAPRTRPAGCAPTSGLVPVDDPTNADPRFVRNRVRHELLPLMDSIAGRDVVALLVRTAERRRRRPGARRRRHRRPRPDRRQGARRRAAGPGPARPAPLARRRRVPAGRGDVGRVLAVARGERPGLRDRRRSPGRTSRVSGYASCPAGH